MGYERFHCKRHEDRTPSVIWYGGDRFFCFSCHALIPAVELGKEGANLEELPPVEPEDLQAKLAYIDALPKAFIRGFNLPIDETGYYLVWPDRSYYKKRRFEGEPKYIGPRGHPPSLVKLPLFGEECRAKAISAIVVEGEFNAKSLRVGTLNTSDIYSPGSAGNFYGKSSKALLTALKNYRTVYIIADQDAAGAKAAIELKSRLLAQGQAYVYISLWAKDANDIMVQDGKEALQKEIDRVLGV